MASTCTLTKTGHGRFEFGFKTHSRNVLMTSGTYLEKENAIRGTTVAHRLARNTRNYEICTAENGQYYFVVKNAEGEVMAQAIGKARGARLEDLTDPNIRNRAHRKQIICRTRAVCHDGEEIYPILCFSSMLRGRFLSSNPKVP
jgi:uncharacterized protein YegP (UPF0339 family)